MRYQGEHLQQAKHEIKQLKDTIQNQATEMKVMNEKLKTHQDIIIKQGLKLDGQEKDIKELKVSEQTQGQQMRILKKQNLIMKKLLMKLVPQPRDKSTNTKKFDHFLRDEMFET